MFFRKKQEEDLPQTVGGIAFFCSLIFLVLLALVNALFLMLHFRDMNYFSALCCGVGLLCGFWFASRFIGGHVAVFVHELKHSIVANLAGNRAKGMLIRRTHGHFEYEYTQDTAAYNAFISLAPYWFPLFLLVVWPLVLLFLQQQHLLAAALVGIAVGLDGSLNMRDVSPYQTDFSIIRGGFAVGLAYVLAMNVVILTFVLVWTTQSLTGLHQLAAFWWHHALTLVTYFRHPTP